MRHHLIPVRRLLETANVSEGLEKREPLYNCGWECKLVQSLRKTVRVCMRVCSVISDPCNPMGCSPPGSFVHGISQERISEWIAISYSKRSSWPRIKPASLESPALAGAFFTHSATWEAQKTVWSVFRKKNPNIKNRITIWSSKLLLDI